MLGLNFNLDIVEIENIARNIFLFCVGIAILLYLIERVIKYYNYFTKGSRTLKDHMDENFKLLSDKMDSINNTLNDKLAKLSNKVNKLEAWKEIISKDISVIFSTGGTVKGKIPLGLTEKGNAILKTLDGKSILQKYINKIIKLEEIEKAKTEYDIQMNSFYIARQKLDEIMEKNHLKKIEEAAYKHGVSIIDVKDVFAILIRNYVLEKKGFDVPEL